MNDAASSDGRGDCGLVEIVFYSGLFSCQQVQIPRKVFALGENLWGWNQGSKKTMPMFRSTFQQRWVLFVVVFLSAAISKGAMVYTTQSAFTSALASGNYFNDFESSPHGGQGTDSLPFSNPTFSFTISTPALQGDLYVVGAHTTGPPQPPGDYPGRAMSTAVDATDLIINFTGSPNPVTAIGANFLLTNLQENRIAGTFDITLRNGTTVLFTDPPDDVADINSPATGVFRGFTTDAGNPITTLTFHPDSVQGFQFFATLDNLYVGQVAPVPEPAATGIAASLLCLLVAGRGILMRVWSRLRSRVA